MIVWAFLSKLVVMYVIENSISRAVFENSNALILRAEPISLAVLSQTYVFKKKRGLLTKRKKSCVKIEDVSIYGRLLHFQTLHTKIGQLTVERDFLAEAWGKR